MDEELAVVVELLGVPVQWAHHSLQISLALRPILHVLRSEGVLDRLEHHLAVKVATVEAIHLFQVDD